MFHVSRGRAFTLIELLAVIAIIVVVIALSLPNFAAMVKAQKWSAAASDLQNALLRARTFALNERHDHSIEFCESTGPNRNQYLRIECESALLEAMPEMNSYLHNVCKSYIHRLPTDWFSAYKNAGGKVIGSEEHPWSPAPDVKFKYDGPIQDIDRYGMKDNLKVDDHIFLPYGIKIDFEKSKNLINYDKKPRNDQDTPQYGWDATVDLRFNVAGVLVQAKNPDIVLVKDIRPPEYRRLQVLRSTARVRALPGLP